MGKLEKLGNGRHVIRGGFSTANQADRELLRPLVEKNLNSTIKKKWSGVEMGKKEAKKSKPSKKTKTKKTSSKNK